MLRIAKSIIDWLGVSPSGQEFGAAINRKLDRQRYLVGEYEKLIKEKFSKADLLAVAKALKDRPRLSADKEWEYVLQAVKTISPDIANQELEKTLLELSVFEQVLFQDVVERVMVESGLVR